MKLKNGSLLGILILLLSACGQNEKSGSTELSLQQYVPQTGSARITGSFEDMGDLNFILFGDNQRDTLQTFTAPGGQLDHSLSELPVNEVYFLEVEGARADDRGVDIKWWYTFPIFLEDGTELTLGQRDNPNTDVYVTPYHFYVDNAGEEQQFLEEWHADHHYDDQIETRTAQQIAEINQDYISKADPGIGNLYLIYRQTDHRSNMDRYQSVYEDAPEQAQKSKYGIDLANRIYRIQNHTQEIDVAKLLASRTSQLHPFNPDLYSDKSYLLLVFWASWEPTAASQIPTIADVISESGKTDVEAIYLSLDTKMSLWKPMTDDMNLDNSFLLRAENRQQAIDELYLTELPRYMIITPDGKIIENDLAFEDLEATIAGLE
ncbi:MAG TPA: thioredoxin family protein [Sphingobacteriaceae bacterium]|nr:thioredoxin family protein [Sphingobacteriaceae bacterium]